MDKYKLLLPWRKMRYVGAPTGCVRGFLMDKNHIAAEIFKNSIGCWRGFLSSGSFMTKEAAMEKEDEYLVRNGFVLLTEEQVEKYRILL